MWLSIILSFIFGAIVCGFVIWGILACYDPNSCILTESEFRNKIANEPYDSPPWSGVKGHDPNFLHQESRKENANHTQL